MEVLQAQIYHPRLPQEDSQAKLLTKDLESSSATKSASAPAKSSVRPIHRRYWSDEEHHALLQELQLLRSEEASKEIALKDWCYGTVLWGKLSQSLKEYNFELFRTPASCYSYWNRSGRVKSGYDERRVQEHNWILATKKQTKKWTYYMCLSKIVGREKWGCWSSEHGLTQWNNLFARCGMFL